MRKIRRFGWIWHTRSSAAMDWIDRMEILRRKPVKCNPVRVVFRASDSSGVNYFVKLEKKNGLFAWLRAVFSSKARSEFESGLLLEQCKIPCARYVAWGRCGAETGIVSETLEGYISARKYWYGTASHIPELAEKHLKNLAILTAAFRKNFLIHPDFHDGNLMVNPANGALAVVDPFGIRRTRSIFYPVCALRMLFSNLAGLRNLFPPEKIAEAVAATGIVTSAEAKGILHEIDANDRLRIAREWPRRRKQILSGKSKFCRTDGIRIIRNSPWFEPAEWNPARLIPEDMPSERAGEIWVESFRKELLYGTPDRLPVILECGHGPMTRVFFAPAGELPL